MSRMKKLPHPNLLPEGEGRKCLPNSLLKIIRVLRKNQTETELKMWSFLRGKNFEGLKFRRQHPIGHYVVDFYCHEKKLVIELDGGGHAEKKQMIQDKERDEFLKSQGLTVFRVWNNEVVYNLEGVIAELYNLCFSEDSSVMHSSLPLGGRRGRENNLKKSFYV